MNRRGFTLIELLTVVVILGVLASIAVPKYQLARSRAQAAELVSAMVTVRGAAFNYQGSLNAWPATTAAGRVPAGLGTYLPAGGTTLFDGPSHTLQWMASTISSSTSRAGAQVIAARTGSAALCAGLYGLLGGAGNADVTGSCGSSGGTVTLAVDR